MDRDVLAKNVVEQLRRRFQHYLDKTVIYPQYRWPALGLLLIIYALRVWSLSGWYIVTYGLSIYLLNLFIGFITPQFDPDANREGLPETNMASPEEYRPFQRKVGEFPFWWKATQATVLAFFMTFFSFFDIPVFWPILLVYFIALFGLTMRNQISHMIKHKYIPISWGKTKYSGGGGNKGGNKKSNAAIPIVSTSEAIFKGSNNAMARTL